MKKLVKTVQGTIKTVRDIVRKFAIKALNKKATACLKLAENRGDFVMDHAVVFVIIIVVAGIAILLLTTFLQTDMGPLLTQKIKDFFN